MECAVRGIYPQPKIAVTWLDRYESNEELDLCLYVPSVQMIHVRTGIIFGPSTGLGPK